MSDRIKQDVQKIPYSNRGGPSKGGDHPRVETGAVQFGEDYPGIFIRGDGAAYLAFSINTILERMEKHPELATELFLELGELKGIRDLIWGDVIVGGWKNNSTKPGETPKTGE
jgi:hypothetical protein